MVCQFWDRVFRIGWDEVFEKYVAKGAEEKD